MNEQKYQKNYRRNNQINNQVERKYDEVKLRSLWKTRSA